MHTKIFYFHAQTINWKTRESMRLYVELEQVERILRV
jgi:hypothetical protein